MPKLTAAENASSDTATGPIVVKKTTDVQKNDTETLHKTTFSLANWRIRNQILGPLIFTLVAGISLSTYFNIRSLVRNENQRVQVQVDNLFKTLSETSFPLGSSVLKQVHQISGVHLAVEKPGVLDSSFSPQTMERIIDEEILKQPASNDTINTVQITLDNEEYSVFQKTLPGRGVDVKAFYPRRQFFAAVRKVVVPQLLSSGITLAVVSLLIVLISRNVTAPIGTLKKKVQKIAEGDFREYELNRNDEIGELNDSINQMARRLSQYQEQIRAQEKLFTLDQMGGGIAHQMRNSITGCRLALDLHQKSCHSDDESLQVAVRQLTFMEDFQKRFLAFTKDDNRDMTTVNLVDIVREYVKLLEPYAQHVNVNLQIELPEEPYWIRGNESMLQQLVGNLVTNAIEAASINQSAEDKRVSIRVHTIDRCPALSIADSGEGISDKIQERIFDPLITTKPDGVGLGLAIVKQTADEHHAKITWHRTASMTCFDIQFPACETQPTVES